MTEITDQKKIESLERLLTAIVGRQDAKIKYRQNCESMIEVIIDDCDPDDVMKIKSPLSTADIPFDFYVTTREVPEAERSDLFPNTYEGVCELTFYLEDQYWKIAEELKEELKKKDKELSKYHYYTSSSATISNDNPNISLSFTSSSQ